MTRARAWDCFGLTDVGKVRENNEDDFLIADLGRSERASCANFSHGRAAGAQRVTGANLVMVADGVGGNAGGERASQLAVKETRDYLYGNRKRLLRRRDGCEAEIGDCLRDALAWAQQCIRHEAEASRDVSRMGTTLTLAYWDWPTAYIAHVGDSRAYLFRQPNLLQLTADQTVAQMLADAGMIDASLVSQHPYRHVLGSCLSWDARDMTPCTAIVRLEEGDQLLLCTDGLTERVASAQIAAILASSPTAEAACEELIAAANAAGGVDNVTAVVSRFSQCCVAHEARGEWAEEGRMGAVADRPEELFA